ncbi:MAG TPA: beta-N-acetylglucosaminidase domain-containing protein, partial [Acidimicrobiales bacterium]|nr:beta-N-acetylglucosaminidase domain-containing protein [Acidimicrobiales bacterium]
MLRVRGVLEGFYGRPWTWDERVAVARWCADRGMPHYVWAPKDEPLHRERWREPWPAEVLAGFGRLAAEPDVVLGVGLSPGRRLRHRDHVVDHGVARPPDGDVVRHPGGQRVEVGGGPGPDVLGGDEDEVGPPVEVLPQVGGHGGVVLAEAGPVGDVVEAQGDQPGAGVDGGPDLVHQHPAVG